MRFVLSINELGQHLIAVCTDWELSAEEILRAYLLRHQIEMSFRALVHTLHAFWGVTRQGRNVSGGGTLWAP